MDKNEIFQKLVEVLKDYDNTFENKTITEETNIVDDLGFDSLMIHEVMFEIEDTFNIFVTDNDILEITTVGDLVEMIYKNI